MSHNPALRVAEVMELGVLVGDAVSVLDGIAPRAGVAELRTAINALRNDVSDYRTRINSRPAYSGNYISSGGSSAPVGRTLSRGVVDKKVKEKVPVVKKSGYRTYKVGVDGDWRLINPDKHEWQFMLSSGELINNIWALLEYDYNGTKKTSWYRFNVYGIMEHGWLKDEASNWYYCKGFFGEMITGWHYDKEDGNWHYLDKDTGVMSVGWKFIDGKWYYFNTSPATDTYVYNHQSDRWEYVDSGVRHLLVLCIVMS